jgi:hypothetical protein
MRISLCNRYKIVNEISILQASTGDYLMEFLFGRLLIHLGNTKNLDRDLDHIYQHIGLTNHRLEKAPEVIDLDRR